MKDKNKYLIQLGANIRLRRKELSISQEELANSADIDRSYVGGIERGERNISILTLLKLVNCLKTSLSQITANIIDEDYDE